MNQTDLETIQSKIYVIRNQKVMFDFDLAQLYGVKTNALNQAVKRNLERFPQDFMFKLSVEEWVRLRSQIATLDEPNLKSQSVTSSWGGTRKIPHVFTQNGIAMLSSVLNNAKAIEVNIQIISGPWMAINLRNQGW
ncbi:MAG: ORF6N domain-containing protein [Leptospirales bacterium]